MTTITIETKISAPRAHCFDVALDVEAHEESAAFSGERLVEPGRTSGTLEEGDLIAFEGRHFGVKQRFVARVVSIDRPHLFVDEMVSGIFRRLQHVHQFEEEGEGTTLMRDILTWVSPLGVLGRLADRLFLQRHMREFVATKQRNLARIAERRWVGGG